MGPTCGFSADDLLADKELAKALAAIKRVDGDAAVKAIRNGTIYLTRAEVAKLGGPS